MSALAVWTFADTGGARWLERLLAEGIAGDVAVTDGAVVTWASGRASAQVRELQGVARMANLGSSFWGMLFGIVVSGPELAAMGGSERALDGALGGVGVDQATLVTLRRRLQAGGSALAVICDAAVASGIDTMRANADRAVTPDRCETTTRALSVDHENALRRVFAS
ncbi:MAG: hypothetical protein BGO47_06700 [Microbacterium sp. 67-17]|uniref:DUF1269 domain-containing protein n=1 Tax=Microbacterium sp. 67-17 TaxID=1895782 RepID=UPI0009685C1D|nr:DUF1269 domain-containing protein [Microbacterium sp. 67-17]OJV93607.1 MAG: hypothetical protein BGO47_06700 [Microbacterium sp. 67-17]